MGRQKHHGGNFILIELMIALFFFAISGAVFLQIFVKAHQLSTSAQEKTQAWNFAARAAELIEAGQFQEQDLQKEFSGQYTEDGTYLCYFDQGWKETNRSKGYYVMKIAIRQSGRTTKGEIKVAKGKKILYQLDVSSYQPERRGYEKT